MVFIGNLSQILLKINPYYINGVLALIIFVLINKDNPKNIIKLVVEILGFFVLYSLLTKKMNFHNMMISIVLITSINLLIYFIGKLIEQRKNKND